MGRQLRETGGQFNAIADAGRGTAVLPPSYRPRPSYRPLRTRRQLVEDMVGEPVLSAADQLRRDVAAILQGSHTSEAELRLIGELLADADDPTDDEEGEGFANTCEMLQNILDDDETPDPMKVKKIEDWSRGGQTDDMALPGITEQYRPGPSVLGRRLTEAAPAHVRMVRGFRPAANGSEFAKRIRGG